MLPDLSKYKFKRDPVEGDKVTIGMSIVDSITKTIIEALPLKPTLLTLG